MKFTLTLSLLFSALIVTSFKTFAEDDFKIPKRCTIYYPHLVEDIISKESRAPEDRMLSFVVYSLIDKGYGFSETPEVAGSVLTVDLGRTKKNDKFGKCEAGEVNYKSIMKLTNDDEVRTFSGDSFCYPNEASDKYIAAYIISVSNSLDSIPDCE